MSGRLAGKRALVTGAAQGLGAGIARALAAQGARVLLTDVNGAGAKAAAAAINADVGTGTAFACAHDVTSAEDWRQALDLASRQLGGLSVLVNNAGIAVDGAIADVELDEWRRAFSVNVDGVFLGCKLALPLLRGCQPGSIVNMSSIAGLCARPGLGAYSASKAAVWMLTRTVALECAEAGWDIRCNSVHPAYIDTPILDPLQQPGASRQDTLAWLGRQIPIGRVGEIRDVAQGVVYLASDESRFMTGAELKLDGGVSAR